MGLKDDLIAKAKSDGKQSNSEEPSLDFDKPIADFEDSMDGGIDFSSIEEDIGLTDSFSNDFAEPVPFSEPEFSDEPQQFADPAAKDVFIPEPQPIVEEERVDRPAMSFQDVMNSKQSFRDPAPMPEQSYGYTSEPQVSDGYMDDGIRDELLSLAKKTILSDISENFNSSIFTKESLQNLINSYNNNHKHAVL